VAMFCYVFTSFKCQGDIMGLTEAHLDAKNARCWD
jgi:hypothetical protein